MNIGINQVLVFSYEGLLHVSHDAGVHSGESLCSVDLQVIPGPLSLGWDALRYQEVPGSDTNSKQLKIGYNLKKNMNHYVIVVLVKTKVTKFISILQTKTDGIFILIVREKSYLNYFLSCNDQCET